MTESGDEVRRGKPIPTSGRQVRNSRSGAKRVVSMNNIEMNYMDAVQKGE